MSAPSLYDEVPYPGRAFPQTHPDRLATIAALYGLDPAPPAACDVLELGCGDGGNLLAMAVTLPGSSFVGVDSSARAIERAKGLATELGLDNVRFEELRFEDYEPAPQSADYVIAHGIYSWVPEPARDRVLALCARALSANGVAYVSYNALPGHRTRQSLRDMLEFALAGVDEPHARMDAARELLTEACAVWQPVEGQETSLGGQAQMLLAHDDALFFHDTLSPSNKALYFGEFAAHAASHGLRFLAEAEYSDMRISGLPDALQRRLLGTEDLVAREHLIDFLKQRMFRQTLLCHAAASPDLVPHPKRVATLAAAGPIESVADTDSGRVTFSGIAGARLTTDHPTLIYALTRIATQWPGSVWVTELAGGESAPDGTLVGLCESLLACCAGNLVRLHVHPPALSTTPGPLPRVSPLARVQARERGHLTTLLHTTVRLEDELGWQLVALLDGTHDRAALLAELESSTGGAYPDLAADIESSLATLARVGLLMPSLEG